MKAGLFAVVAVALLVTLVAAGAQGASAPIPGFRPPAVPLVLMDPYMNVWLRGTNLTDAWATYVPLPSSFFSRPNSFAFVLSSGWNSLMKTWLCRYWDGTVKALVGVRQESVFLFLVPPLIIIMIISFSNWTPRALGNRCRSWYASTARPSASWVPRAKPAATCLSPSSSSPAPYARLAMRNSNQVASLLIVRCCLQVYPTQSVFTFGAKGVELTVTFTTPLLTDDIEVMSRPVTYLTFSVRACVVRVRWCVRACVVWVRSPFFDLGPLNGSRGSPGRAVLRQHGRVVRQHRRPVRRVEALLWCAQRSSCAQLVHSSAHTTSSPPLLRFENARGHAHRHLRPARPAARTLSHGVLLL
jgi:hypothetical protein